MAKEAQVTKSLDDLHEELATKRQDLLQAKRSHAAGELANPRALGDLRKDIARLLTQINQKEHVNG